MLGLSPPAQEQHAPTGGPEAVVECDVKFESDPGAKETALCFYELAKDQEHEASAAGATRRLSTLAAEHPNLPWLSFYVANLRYSDAVKAERLYQRAAERFYSLGITEGEVYSRSNRIKLLSRLGREEEARQEIERVFALTEDSPDPELRAWGQIELVRQLYRTGQDLARAYSVLQSMEVSRWSGESFSMRRDRLLLLGNVCIQIGRLDEGREAFEAVAAMAAEVSQPFLEATARYNLAALSFERRGTWLLLR
jgi:tetratricopeptide (TPR) repeat protein